VIANHTLQAFVYAEAVSLKSLKFLVFIFHLNRVFTLKIANDFIGSHTLQLIVTKSLFENDASVNAHDLPHSLVISTHQALNITFCHAVIFLQRKNAGSCGFSKVTYQVGGVIHIFINFCSI